MELLPPPSHPSTPSSQQKSPRRGRALEAFHRASSIPSTTMGKGGRSWAFGSPAHLEEIGKTGEKPFCCTSVIVNVSLFMAQRPPGLQWPPPLQDQKNLRSQGRAINKDTKCMIRNPLSDCKLCSHQALQVQGKVRSI